MRWVILLVGLGIGFALDRVSGPEWPNRMPRESHASGQPTLEAHESDGNAARGSVAEESPLGDWAGVEPLVVQPGAAIPEDEQDGDWGQIVVDFGGTDLERAATIEGRDFSGRPESEPGFTEGDEDERILFDVRAGRYYVWWYDAEFESIGTDVDVAAGRVTVVPATVGRKRALRSALGRVIVQVCGIDGAPLAGVAVEVEGAGNFYAETIGENTSHRGRCAFDLVPGPIEVVVGNRIVETIVEAGKATTVRIEYEREGELAIFAAPRTALFSIRTDDGAEWESLSHDGRALVRFVPAGDHFVEVRFLNNGRLDHRRLGPYRINPRQRTEVDCGLPAGLLDVRVNPQEGNASGRLRVRMRALDVATIPLEVESELTVRTNESMPRGWWQHEFVALSPGRYELWIEHPRWEPARRQVEIGSNRLELEVVLQPRGRVPR